MISVVLTTYNGEKYIIDQLKSIINQSLVPNEILIGDDNSTDSTLDYIYDFCNSRNIKYFINDEGAKKSDTLYIRIFTNKENVGYNKNFIRLIKKTNYNLVFLSDQDDIWYKDKIKAEYNLLMNKDANCIASLYDIIYKNKNIKNVFYQKVIISDLSNTSFYGMTMLIKKDSELYKVLNLMENDNTFLYYDRILTLYYVLNKDAYLIKTPLVYHRIHDNNAVGDNRINIRGNLKVRVNIAKDYYNDIIVIEEYFNKLNINLTNYKIKILNKLKSFRLRRYEILNSLLANNNLYNKLKLFKFVLFNFYKYPYLKSIFGDLYYIFK